MIEAKGYSIWLEPEGEVKYELSLVIEDLSQKFDTPGFDPHVTLLGGIEFKEEEVTGRVKGIASHIAPFTLAVTGTVECEDHWTKSLFLMVSETVDVLGANRAARTTFSMEEQAPYHPHLSLMYSEGIPINERRRIAHIMSGLFACRVYVTKLNLYRTEGGVEDWEKIGEFELTGH